MIARAPGKLVLSGAYSVFEGAPAIVTAVDRYVVADSAREAELVTGEVREAIRKGCLRAAPWFDASALRTQLPDGTSRKLGLGSSAAIVVASVATLATHGEPQDALQKDVFREAFRAHQRAQPLGSGIDVAASVHGGVIVAELRRPHRTARINGVAARPHELPAGTVVEVFACTVSASTSAFIGAIRALAEADAAAYGGPMRRAVTSALAAVSARSIAELVAALDWQFDALGALGDAAGIPIVTPEMRALIPSATAAGAAFGPSGAGGGDIAIWVGPRRSPKAFRAAAAKLGFERLDIAIGARGVHLVDR